MVCDPWQVVLSFTYAVDSEVHSATNWKSSTSLSARSGIATISREHILSMGAAVRLDRNADELHDESLLSCISYILYIEEKTTTTKLIYTNPRRVLPGDHATLLHLFSQENNTRALIGRQLRYLFVSQFEYLHQQLSLFLIRA